MTPTLVSPEKGKPLLYITATTQVVSAALVIEREENGHSHKIQRLVRSSRTIRCVTHRSRSLFMLSSLPNESYNITLRDTPPWSWHRSRSKTWSRTMMPLAAWPNRQPSSWATTSRMSHKQWSNHKSSRTSSLNGLRYRCPRTRPTMNTRCCTSIGRSWPWAQGPRSS
jgi:hypothetical protein